MGLNGVSNPAKLRKLAALIGEEVAYACARYFADQRQLLVFGVSGRAYVVDRFKTVEEHTDPRYVLSPYRDETGVACGVHQVPRQVGEGATD